MQAGSLLSFETSELLPSPRLYQLRCRPYKAEIFMSTQVEKNTERIERLAHESIPRLLIHYGVPAIVGTMVNALYSVVDRIFIGQGVSEFAITGLALTFPILIFVQAFGMLIGVGASSRVSILLGENKHDQAERILSNALLLTLVTQVLTLVPVMIWLDDILRALGANDRTLPFAYDYLKIMIPGNIFSTLCFSFNAIMRASGYPYKAMITMLIGAGLNTLLDALFIYGFDWGIEGAAWATVIAMAVSSAFVMQHFLSSKSEVQFRRRNMRLSSEQILAILSIGMSPFFLQLLSSGIAFLINSTLARYAENSLMADRAVGAYGIINSAALWALCSCSVSLRECSPSWATTTEPVRWIVCVRPSRSARLRTSVSVLS